jgi:hypothetical protein
MHAEAGLVSSPSKPVAREVPAVPASLLRVLLWAEDGLLVPLAGDPDLDPALGPALVPEDDLTSALLIL